MTFGVIIGGICGLISGWNANLTSLDKPNYKYLYAIMGTIMGAADGGFIAGIITLWVGKICPHHDNKYHP